MGGGGLQQRTIVLKCSSLSSALQKLPQDGMLGVIWAMRFVRNIPSGRHILLLVTLHAEKPAEPQSHLGFPGGASGKEPACQCRRCKR